MAMCQGHEQISKPNDDMTEIKTELSKMMEQH